MWRLGRSRHWASESHRVVQIDVAHAAQIVVDEELLQIREVRLKRITRRVLQAAIQCPAI